MSPILVRPVREQLEHDRIIRQLQAKFRRKYEPAINPGSEQNTPVGSGASAIYPDVVLLAPDRGHKVLGLIEVETGESVNHLEALAQWAHFAKARLPFYLYVPAGMVDVARRLSEDNNIYVTEIWSYHAVGDQIRFTMVHRSKEAPLAPVKKAAPPKKPAAAARKAAPPKKKPRKPSSASKPAKKKKR